MSIEKMLTAKEAAKVLGMNYRLVLSLIYSGEIESILIGAKQRRVTETALARWQYLAQGKPEPKAAPKAKKKAPSMKELLAREAAMKGPIPRRRYGDVAKA